MPQVPPNGVQRRLSAILAADMDSYSRLKRSGEEPTQAKLTALLMDARQPSNRRTRRPHREEHWRRVLGESPKTDCLWRVATIPALRDFPLWQRLLHFYPFAPPRFESIIVFQCASLRVQWIARLLCHNACNFFVGLRGCLLGPFQQ
jgi:hypothetical protein